MPVEGLPILLPHRLGCEREQLMGRKRIGQDRVARGAHGVDVHMRDAPPVEVTEPGVSIPGRARVAAVRMAGPEAEPETAPELVAPGREQARNFQHGGIGAAVVHHAEVPGVMMAGEQDEAVVGRVGRVQIGFKDRGLAPAGIDLGEQGGLDVLSAQDTRLQGIAIRLADAQHDGLRQQVALRGRGAAPHRRDAHLVKVLQRRDVDLPDGPGLRGKQARGGVGHPLEKHDAPGGVGFCEVGRGAGAGIDHRCAHTVGPRRARKRVRNAVRLLAANQQPRRPGQADVGVTQHQLRAEPMAVELAAEVLEAFEFLRRPG